MYWIAENGENPTTRRQMKTYVWELYQHFYISATFKIAFKIRYQIIRQHHANSVISNKNAFRTVFKVNGKLLFVHVVLKCDSTVSVAAIKLNSHTLSTANMLQNSVDSHTYSLYNVYVSWHTHCVAHVYILMCCNSAGFPFLCFRSICIRARGIVLNRSAPSRIMCCYDTLLVCRLAGGGYIGVTIGDDNARRWTN